MGNTASRSYKLRSMRLVARRANQLHRRARLSYNGAEELHRHTRSRFVWDEAHELAQRHVSLDVKALATIAAEAVGSSHCTSMQRLLDGNYNKALLLTMNDGTQAVAKIPNPNAGRPHLTIASEVATMDLARNELQTPVPKVYAWCSHAECTPVGAEYIIMEKAKGVLLDTVLPKMDSKQRAKLAQAVADYQMQWAEAVFQSYGSLYYRPDLPAEAANNATLLGSSEDDMKRFVVGPTTERSSIGREKTSSGLDLGPWKNALDYLKAAGHRETVGIKQIDRPPRSPVSVFGPGTYEPSKEKKLRAAESYQDILPHLISKDSSLLKPCVGHPELDAENIFVNQEDPTEVTAIIGWQAVEIAPLFNQVGKPSFINYEGPKVNGLEEPCLPDDFEELPELEWKQTQDRFIRQTLVVLYNTWINLRSQEMWRAMEFQQTLEYGIMTVVRIIAYEGEATLLAMILKFLKEHPEILNADAQVETPAIDRLLALVRDRDITQKDAEDAEVAVHVMKEIREAMSDLFPVHGQVSHDKYEESKKMLREIKEQVIDQFARSEQDRIAWQESWPFED